MTPLGKELIGHTYHVPYRRLFPIWRYGLIYSKLDGRHVRDGWQPDWWGKWSYPTLQAALIDEKTGLRRGGYIERGPLW